MARNKKEGKPSSFTFYDGFAEAVEKLPDNRTKAAFVYDFYQFGAWGIEPTFAWATDPMLKMAVEMAWSIAVPSIEKNVKDRKNGKKGGRPRKNKTEVADTFTQAAIAAEQLYEPIPDEVIAMIEPAYDEIEVF